jgi:hypothetical protein
VGVSPILIHVDELSVWPRGSISGDSLLENRTFVSGPIFHLYRVFLPPVQMWSFVSVLAPPGTNGLSWTRIGGPPFAPGTIVNTFLPGRDRSRYKCRTPPAASLALAALAKSFYPALTSPSIHFSFPYPILSHLSISPFSTDRASAGRAASPMGRVEEAGGLAERSGSGALARRRA